MDLRGLHKTRGEVLQVRIDQLYTPLTAVHAAVPDKPERAMHLGQGDFVREQRSVPLQEALRQRRVVIVGGPGSGKTTFLRRIGFAACEDLLGQSPGAASAFLGEGPCPFPLYVQVSRLVTFIRQRVEAREAKLPADKDSPAWIPLYLAGVASDRGWKLDRGFFERKLKDGCLLMVDGLDEAPERISRKSAARLLEEAGRCFDKSCIVATSRPPSYGGEAVIPGFDTVQVAPLEPAAVGTFLDLWCHALYGDPTAVLKHRVLLEWDLDSKPEIRELAGVPIMLTALAVLHYNNKRLPHQRADLYDSILGWLAESRKEKPGRVSADRCLGLMRELAWIMHTHADGKRREISSLEASRAIAPLFHEKQDESERIAAAERFLEAEELDSGIIVQRGEKYEFWHPTFQEYLAAQLFAVRTEECTKLLVRDGRALLPEWRETVLLLGGVLCRQEWRQLDAFVAALLDRLGGEPALRDRAECVGLLGSIAEDLRARDYRIADARYRAHLQEILPIFEPGAADIELRIRLEAAEALGRAGDPRLSQENWVTLQGGEFWMGAQNNNEKEPNYDP